MAATKGLIPIRGSEHPAIEGSRAVGRPDSEETAEVTVYLRSRSPIPVEAALEGHETRHLTHEEFESRHGASDDDLAKVRAFAKEQGLLVVEASSAKRRVRILGTIERLERAFGVDLVCFEHATGRHRGHEGEVHLPAELHEIVIGVLGLDDRPMSRRQTAEEPLGPDDLPEGAFTPPQVAEAYDFPRGLDGGGQCIGIVELGGGFFCDELATYFAGLGIPMPEITTVGPNRPGTREKPDRINVEVALDIEVAGSIAPKAKYVFYFGDNTGPGFINTIGEALADRENAPSVISVSWGAPEVDWPENGAEIMEHNIQAAAALGVTVCIASGDFGATEGLTDGRIAPSFPASVPSALGCGGTRLSAPNQRYESEVVWDQLKDAGRATGGGVSTLFALPGYQKRAAVPPVPKKGAKPGFVGRGVPDVAGNADKRSGYLVFVNGKWDVYGGTSAVAPLWAALIAMMNQALGRRAGFLNPFLYKLESSDVFHVVTSGNNGYYDAGPGWNACTGLGSPVGSKLLAALAEKVQPPARS